jgi:hypothetical protein
LNALESSIVNDPGRQQSEVLLRRVVEPNAQCEYGRRHAFASIRTTSDFRSAVPICNYEDLRGYIDRMAAGEQSVLVSEPVRRFFVTSGSTAAPKLVPVTTSFVRDKWRGMQKYWQLTRQTHAIANHGWIVTNFSDGSNETRTSGGFLCGSESSFWNSWGRPVDRTGNTLPRLVYKIQDPHARYYTIARMLLGRPVSVLMSLNPSTILLLLQTINTDRELLIRDMEQGGISAEIPLESSDRATLASLCPPDPGGARELMALLERGGSLRAKDLWREMKVVICWRSPMVQPYLSLMEPLVGDVPQRDYILMASEGMVAIPFEDGISGGVLTTDIHFYEFIPENCSGQTDPPTLLAGELEKEQNYVVVLSTSAGLYRYNLGDVVKVRGFFGHLPVLEFLYRVGHTCSLTGEKLTEDQVSIAVAAGLSRLGLHVRGFTLYPVPLPFPHYGLAAEFVETLTYEDLRNLLEQIDRELAHLNIEYKAKRSSCRLAALEVSSVRTGSYAAYRHQRSGNQLSETQIKVPCLTRDTSFLRSFDVIDQLSCESVR